MFRRKRVRRFPVRTTLASQPVETSVDSELARYYLERYLTGFRDDPRLDRLIDEVHTEIGGTPLTRSTLEELSRRFSTDFATACLAARICGDTCSRSFRTLYENELMAARAGSTLREYPAPPGAECYTFCFVPGWVYESVRDSGADFAGPRALLTARGMKNRLITIDECGTIENNAAQIAADLRAATDGHTGIVLVSASSGGASTALALATLSPRERQHVKAWVNVAGLLQGSVMADRAIRLPRRLFVKTILFIRGWYYDSIVSMTTERGRERFARHPIPDDLFCVNYVGIPFSGDISRRVRQDYLWAREQGPNDGLTLITDALIPHGVTIPVMGADHFHADPESDLRSVALSQAVIKHLTASPSPS